jgi:hypothetical protein
VRRGVAVTLTTAFTLTAVENQTVHELRDMILKRREVGLNKLNPVVTHSLKAPGFSTLEPTKGSPGFKPLLAHATCAATPRRPTPS